MTNETRPHALSLTELAARLKLPQDYLGALADMSEIPYTWSQGCRRFNETAVRLALDGKNAAGMIHNADAFLDLSSANLLFEAAGKKLLDFIRAGTLGCTRIQERFYFRRRDIERLLGGAVYGPVDMPQATAEGGIDQPHV
jgi:hypothetical protein